MKGDKGIKFENFVVTSLLKHSHARIDYYAEDHSLRYLQTKERHEVDFVLVNDNKIEMIIETKYSNHRIGKGIAYFSKKYQFPAYQVVKELRHEKKDGEIKVINAANFLKDLAL